MERWIKYVLLFAIVVVLQSLVFSHIQFKGMINAFPYIYFIIVLPFSVSGRNIILLSALLGFGVDFFTGTMGVHMAAVLIAGYSRIILLPLLSQSDYETGSVPSVNQYGWGWFLRYAMIITLIHHIALFMMESFTFVNIGSTLLNALVSSIFSMLFIAIFQSSTGHRNS